MLSIATPVFQRKLLAHYRRTFLGSYFAKCWPRYSDGMADVIYGIKGPPRMCFQLCAWCHSALTGNGPETSLSILYRHETSFSVWYNIRVSLLGLP